MHQMAKEGDWMPGAELQAACKELCEMREWLAAIQGQNVLLLPCKETPALQAPLDLADSQSSESEMGDQAEEHRTDVLPQSDRKQGTKVLEVDQVEHLLTGGQWEGLGTIRKGAEICIKVHVAVDRWSRCSADQPDTQCRANWCSPP